MATGSTRPCNSCDLLQSSSLSETRCHGKRYICLVQVFPRTVSWCSCPGLSSIFPPAQPPSPPGHLPTFSPSYPEPWPWVDIGQFGANSTHWPGPWRWECTARYGHHPQVPGSPPASPRPPPGQLPSRPANSTDARDLILGITLPGTS